MMWGRRPQAPAKGTCPFGNPEITILREPVLCAVERPYPKIVIGGGAQHRFSQNGTSRGFSRDWSLERGLGQRPNMGVPVLGR